MSKLSLIVIEGTDGCGKFTQAQILTEKLISIGVNAKMQSFPNYESPSAGPVKMYLGGELCENAEDFDAYQSSVLFSVDRLCTLTKMKQSLEKDTVLICDRFVASNLIHQGSKLKTNEEKDKFARWLEDLEFGDFKLPRPSATIYLNLPTEISKRLANERASLKNGEKKDIHENNFEHLEKSHQVGLYYANKLNWNVIECNKGNTMRTREDIAAEIWVIVSEKLNIMESVNEKES